jgi:hypothetical protein
VIRLVSYFLGLPNELLSAKDFRILIEKGAISATAALSRAAQTNDDVMIETLSVGWSRFEKLKDNIRRERRVRFLQADVMLIASVALAYAVIGTVVSMSRGNSPLDGLTIASGFVGLISAIAGALLFPPLKPTKEMLVQAASLSGIMWAVGEKCVYCTVTDAYGHVIGAYNVPYTTIARVIVDDHAEFEQIRLNDKSDSTVLLMDSPGSNKDAVVREIRTRIPDTSDAGL